MEDKEPATAENLVVSDNIVQTDQTAFKFASDSTPPPPVAAVEAKPVVEARSEDPPTVPVAAPVKMVSELKTKEAVDPPPEEGNKRQAKKDRYAELVDRALRKERLSYLKRLGINTEIMSDEHILSLSPDVDVETPEGKVAIDEWRAKEANERLFVKKEASEVDIESLVSDYKGSAHGTFGKDLVIRTLQRLAGK